MRTCERESEPEHCWGESEYSSRIIEFIFLAKAITKDSQDDVALF